MTKEKVLITGANGSFAKRLKLKLSILGYDVVCLSSNPKKVDNKNIFFWDISNKILDEKAIIDCQHIVHLSGFSIVKPWTSKNKQLMYESRVRAANLLFEKCLSHHINPKTFITASAMGYYGLTSEQQCKETDVPAKGWLSELCVDWEGAAHQFEQLGSRVVKMRISLLLSKNEGFLKPTLLSMKFGVLTVFGSGSQPIEWIHIDDAVKFAVFALQQTHINGAYNLAANHKLSQYEFMKTLKSQLAPNALMIKLPNYLLNIIFGQRSAILVGGCGLSSKKLLSSGFELDYPTLENVIEKKLKRNEL